MNIKKLDDIDVVFIDEPWSEEDRKEFSAFLQKRKTKKNVKRTAAARERVTGKRKKQL